MPKKKDNPISSKEALEEFLKELKDMLNPLGYVIVNIRDTKDKETKH